MTRLRIWSPGAIAGFRQLMEQQMTEWRKSSRSGSFENSDCVEVADLTGAVGIRDSKAPDAGYLRISAESFAGLLARAKQGDLDL